MQHLYVFALNGLMKVIKLVKYVDDTFVSLFYKNDVVSKLEHWYKSSFLLINAEKTRGSLFSTMQTHPHRLHFVANLWEVSTVLSM